MNKIIIPADNTIDFLKFIFSIFVVGIHVGILNGDEYGKWFLLHWLFRMAVPFFFVASGYYFGKKLWNATYENLDVLFSSYRKRLILPLVTWGGRTRN